MARLSPVQMERLLGVIPNLYSAALDGPDAVTDALLRVVAKLIANNMVTYDEVVPGEGVRLRQFPDHPAVAPLLPALATWLPTHPIMPAFHEHGPEPARSSDFATLNEFRETAIHREIYRFFEVDHQMYLFPQGPEFARMSVTLNRSRRDFTEEEREFLRQLAPHFVQARRSAAALAEARGQRDLLRSAGVDRRQESVFLDPDGRLMELTGRAARWLREYFPDPKNKTGLPEAVRRWLARQWRGAAPDGRPDDVAGCLVAEGTAGRLVVRWYQDAAGRQMLLLTEEVPLFSTEALAGAGLSPREAEVLRWMAEGKTDYEMGVLLNISEHTVHTHARRILDKLDAPNRAAALLRVYERLGRV